MLESYGSQSAYFGISAAYERPIVANMSASGRSRGLWPMARFNPRQQSLLRTVDKATLLGRRIKSPCDNWTASILSALNFLDKLLSELTALLEVK